VQAAVRLDDASGVPTGTNASGRSPMASSRACPARSGPVVAAITSAAVLPRDQVAEPKLERVPLLRGPPDGVRIRRHGRQRQMCGDRRALAGHGPDFEPAVESGQPVGHIALA
jgi:hypothetical protein